MARKKPDTADQPPAEESTEAGALFVDEPEEAEEPEAPTPEDEEAAQLAALPETTRAAVDALLTRARRARPPIPLTVEGALHGYRYGYIETIPWAGYRRWQCTECIMDIVKNEAKMREHVRKAHRGGAQPAANSPIVVARR